MRALLAFLLLAAAPVLATKGTAGTSSSPWPARLLSIPAQPGRYQITVDGRADSASWTWRGTATVRAGRVEVNGAGSATVRVYLDGGQFCVDVDSVGVRATWRAEVTL